MCVAAPGLVISIEPGRAAVRWGSRVQQVTSLFVPDVEVGDYVLVTGGTIIDRLEPDEARARLEMFEALGELLEEESGA